MVASPEAYLWSGYAERLGLGAGWLAPAPGVEHMDRSFRWDITGPNGRSALSILLAAHTADKRVMFDEPGCYSNYPSFAFLIVLDN